MSMKSTPELVRPSRRPPRATRSRAAEDARGRLRRVIAGVLEQGGVLGPRAAIGGGCPGGRELHASAVDEPGAGRVHALKSGKIEDYAFRIVARRDERGPGRLELAPGGDGPRSGQRQDDAVLAGFTSYGRRRGHQALRPETALISRDPAPCRAGTTARPGRGSGQQQTKYELETRHRDSDSRTKRVESLCGPARRPSGLSLRRRPFLSRPG